MFHELADPVELTAAELHDRYRAALVEIIDEQGIEAVIGSTDIERNRLQNLLDGDDSELTLEESAAVFALDEGAPDAETIAVLARDELLMGMTTAVLDVEAVESGLGGELEAREIQSKVEGRFPMTLREFALLYAYIGGKR